MYVKHKIALTLFMTFISSIGFDNVAYSKDAPPIISLLKTNRDKATVKVVCSKLKIIRTTLDLYKLDKFKYPSTEEGLNSLIKNNNIKKKKNLLDNWDTPYVYKNDDMGISLISLGADKKNGGEGINADISLANYSKH